MSVYKGQIVTCDESNQVFQYLVEEDGLITGLFDALPHQYETPDIIDLNDRALLPSFGDTHMHFSSWALFSSTLDVREAVSFKDMKERLTDFNIKRGPKIILGFGVSGHTVQENRLPDKHDIDRMVEDKPVMLIKYDGHACCVNSKLLHMFPDKMKTLRGYDPETGIFTQEAFFFATDHVTSRVSVTALLKYMLESVDVLADKGISLIHTTEGVGFPLDLDVDLVRFLVRGLKNKTCFRIFFQTMDVRKVLKRKLPRVGGCFKTALDGCFGSCDAALLSPYSHEPLNKGILYYSDDELCDFVKKANRQHLQIQLHAIGDAAFNQAIRVFAKALQDYPRTDHRHSIIHGCLISDHDLEHCAELGIIIAAQPAFLHWSQEPYSYFQDILGERAGQISPFRTMQDLGIHVSGGSDAPCTLPDPVFGLYCACNHYNQNQSVTIAEGLRMFTYETAYSGFDEKERGSLETGKKADMIILNKNPLTLNPEDLRKLHVEQLIIGGLPHQRGQTLSNLVFNSLKIKLMDLIL